MRPKKYVYFTVTNDKYEYPLKFYDSIEEMAEGEKTTVNSIRRTRCDDCSEECTLTTNIIFAKSEERKKVKI